MQAAINAARADLPATLRSNPTYRKVNPADAPILILALTSTTLTPGPDLRRRLHHPAAAAVAGRRASARSMSAAARCRRCGSSSTRSALFNYGIGLEDVRAALASANANSPKGAIEDGELRFQIYTNDQARKAARLPPLVVAYRNGAAVRLSDVADVIDRSRTSTTSASPTASRRCSSSSTASPAPTSSTPSTG